MQLHHPVIITARLMPGVKVGKAFVSIGYSKKSGEGGRTRYDYFIDLGKKKFKGSDLQSGAGGGCLQGGLGSLLSFLAAAGEGHGYRMRTGRKSENEESFPEWVNEWAHENSDELSMLSTELEERAGSYIEE